MFGRRFGKMLKTAILAGLLCFQSVPVSAGVLNACGEKVESVLGKAGDAIGNALVLHAEAAENTGTSIASGTWGTCPWKIYVQGGETILDIGAGTGTATASTSPWKKYASQITKVKVTGSVVLPSDSSYLFYDFAKATSIDVSKFDTSKVTNMYYMFGDCSMLTSLDLSKFDTSKVATMSYMFKGCSALTSLDVSKFDTSNVTDMHYMLCNCSALTSLDLCNFDTSKVTNMNNMFYDCSSLTSLDVSKFNTSKVTDMHYMFGACSGLTSLDLSSFDTSQVTNMRSMFLECSTLTSLDLSSFDTSQVTNMRSMFYGCSSLTSLDLSKFDTSKVTNMSGMFDRCSSLESISFGQNWKQTLSDTSLPNHDWVQTRDKNGKKQLSATHELSASNVTYVGSDKAVRVAKDAANHDDANDLYLAGTWKCASALYYDKDADGDETYISKDIVSGQKDSSKPYYDADDDTYEEWIKDGNTWKYTFKVFDDSKKYFVSEDNVDGYSKLFSSKKSSSYGIINDGTASRSESITNTKHDFGSLQITKTVTGANLPSDAQTHLFTFTVVLKDRNGNQLTGPLLCGTTAFNNGIATVTASASKPVTINNIPIGYTYTVTEEDTSDYTESAPVSGTIAKDTTATAAFTNTYVEKPKPKTADVTLTKKITGRYGDTLPDDSYAFSIEFMNLEANESYSIVDNAGKTAATFTANDSGHAAATLSLKPNETVTIKALPVGSTYMITEEAGDYTASYTVSNAASIGRIASPAGSNTAKETALSTAEETVDDGEQTAVTFTNDVEKTQTLTLKKFVGKGKSSNDATADGGFDFTENTASTEKYNFTIKFYNLAESDFRNVPVGTKYVITEAETPCDVKVSVTGTNVATQTAVTPSSDPYHATSLETVDYGEDSVVTFKNRVNDTAALQIVKEAFSGDRLPGAEFTIYNADQSDTIKDAKGNALKLTTTSSGYSNVVTGLTVGTYYIVETKAPSGYSVIEPMKLEITNDDLGKTKKIVIRDSILIVLPNTGGEGIWKYALIVTGLAAGFTAVTIATRKKQKKAA